MANGIYDCCHNVMNFVYTEEHTQNLDDSIRLMTKQGESMETTATVQPSTLIYSSCKLVSSSCYLSINLNFMILCIHIIQNGMDLVMILILELLSQGMEELQAAGSHPSVNLKELL